ncbi:hypothetical protein, conserved [Plasmodium gonderi]|uniref:Uncharacterized protein n=1 Tax=Plasmodium gonderi TaxID=77519 RepID=A0A1Y1JR18_PLAGO|nr:hypothetical protein, conserved [Plasmodium gonderi]GAW82923.1 hypothetical protein, conserved [Plasmodium gonderi]
MEYSLNNKKRKKNLMNADSGISLKGMKEGSYKNRTNNGPSQLYIQNVFQSGIYYTHNDVRLGKAKKNNIHNSSYMEPNTLHSYYKQNKANRKVEEMNYVFYEPLRYPAFKISDRLNSEREEKPEGEKGEKDEESKELREEKASIKCIEEENSGNRRKRKKGKVRFNLNDTSYSIDETICSMEGEGKGNRNFISGKNKLYDSGHNKNEHNYERRDETKDLEKAYVSPTDESNFYPKKGREKMSNLIPIKLPTLILNSKEISNEIKFMLHMTILTFYRDQIKPAYSRIKERLAIFNEGAKMNCNFMNIYISLHNEYIVVKSKRNHYFVLLRETPKWFCGWIKTQSFANPYPKNMWKKLINYFLHVCSANVKENIFLDKMVIQFVKHLCKERLLFFLNSNIGDEEETLGELPTLCNVISYGEPMEISEKLFTYSFFNNSFSYFSHANDNFVNKIESALTRPYAFVLKDGEEGEERNEEEEEHTVSESAISMEKKKQDRPAQNINFNVNCILKPSEFNISTCHASRSSSAYYTGRTPWELDSDIYKAANKLKEENFPFLKDYSLGKIAHIIQLSLYNGLLHKENHVIKPACCCTSVSSSVFCISGGEGGDPLDCEVPPPWQSEPSSLESEMLLWSSSSRRTVNQREEEEEEEGEDKEEEGEDEDEGDHRSLNFRCIESKHSPNEEWKRREKKEEDPFLKIFDKYMKNNDRDLFFKCCKSRNRKEERWKMYQSRKNVSIMSTVPTMQEAKTKIDKLLRCSHGKIIFLCSFKDKFFKKYRETINPLILGCSSLITFLFFCCKDVCKIFILNKNIILMHPSCDMQFLKHFSTENGKVIENVIEDFDYDEYCHSTVCGLQSDKFKNESLEICTIMKNLPKNKNKFFITFSFWKYMNDRGKKLPSSKN